MPHDVDQARCALLGAQISLPKATTPTFAEFAAATALPPASLRTTTFDYGVRPETSSQWLCSPIAC